MFASEKFGVDFDEVRGSFRGFVAARSIKINIYLIIIKGFFLIFIKLSELSEAKSAERSFAPIYLQFLFPTRSFASRVSFLRSAICDEF